MKVNFMRKVEKMVHPDNAQVNQTNQVLGVAWRKIVWAEAQIWAAWGEICASGAPNDFSRWSGLLCDCRR